MLINVDKLWKPASQPPTESGFYYCITSVKGVPAYSRQELFYDHQVTSNWIGLYPEQKVVYWIHIPCPQKGHLISIPNEVILEDKELAEVIVKPPEDEDGVAVSVLIRVTDFSQLDEDISRPAEVLVDLISSDSKEAKSLGCSHTTFIKAKQELEREEESYRDE